MSQQDILKVLNENKGNKFTLKQIKRISNKYTSSKSITQLVHFGFVKREIKGCNEYLYWVE